jgi:dihydroorotate dehydrogenase (fumarate)
MNAAGVRCTTENDLVVLNNSASGAVITKSCTLLSRKGNPLPRYYDNDILSINSSGLPNLGYMFYMNLPQKYKFTKPYIISVSGLSFEDNIMIVEEIINYNDNDANIIAGIELNLSCPNIIGKSQTGYNFEEMDKLLGAVAKIISKSSCSLFHFGIKLPPYFDEYHFKTAADIINKYNVDSITCINSLGNGLVVNPVNETIVIKPKNGFGGIGGQAIKATALANVHKFANLTNCDIIGCGGITNGQDVFEHILCGASAVQIGTELYKDAAAIERITNEFMSIMRQKGYTNINQIKNKLKKI